MKKLQYQGMTAFRQEGKGIPFLFLHGFCEDSRMWEGLIRHFSEREILCIDLPGFGQSEVRQEVSIQGMAVAVREMLESLGWDALLCFGHSMGGYVALALAEQRPDLLRGLGMLHSHPYADTEEKKVARDRSLTFLEENGVKPYVRQLIPTLFAPEFTRAQRPLVEELVRQAEYYAPEGIAAALRAMRDRLDRSRTLEELQAPVLFLIGAEDAAIPQEMSRRQTTLPAVGQVECLEGVGHMGMFEAPEQALGALRRFIKLCSL